MLVLFGILFQANGLLTMSSTVADLSLMCGRSQGERENFLLSDLSPSYRVLGLDATSLQEPWTVSIVKEERTKLHCSGSIISEEHILTSAHCFSSIDKKSLQIVAGATDPLGPEKEVKKRGGEIVKIKDVTIHDLYNAESRSAYYDVAIVEVAQKFIFKETIYPICIPEKAMENNKHLVGKGTVISGYGSIDEKYVLTRAPVVVRDQYFCNRQYRLLPLDDDRFFEIQRVVKYSVSNKPTENLSF